MMRRDQSRNFVDTAERLSAAEIKQFLSYDIDSWQRRASDKARRDRAVATPR